MAINIMIFAALAVVVATLIGGMINMVRGGSGEGSRSNKLMRVRIIVQAIAVVLLMIGFYLKSNSGG
ncbi:MAG: twin transmembrane helix small protein [Robiginitomaculum sp.]|nr:twin transmembrane helix small protein [Robiginitomaculum sp.]